MHALHGCHAQIDYILHGSIRIDEGAILKTVVAIFCVAGAIGICPEVFRSLHRHGAALTHWSLWCLHNVCDYRVKGSGFEKVKELVDAYGGPDYRLEGSQYAHPETTCMLYEINHSAYQTHPIDRARLADNSRALVLRFHSR